MSRVFLVHELALDRKIVVKVLPPELAAGLSVERFKREILLAARLQHPHIVPVLMASAEAGLLHYAMPFIAGESLRARLARHHELPISEVTRILRDVVDALAHAHSEGVVHRDIKPDNILMAGNHALVTDFGVSRAVSSATDESDLTSAGMALGTPAYMSPEQAAADPAIDHRADIYSVGAVGYELLTGRPPFAGLPPQQVLAAHLSRAPEHVSSHRASAPPALAAMVMRCLEKRPADRWQSANDLLSQLEALATPSGGMEPTSRLLSPARRLDWRIAAIAGAVAVTVVGAWWMKRPVPIQVVGSTVQITNAPGLELDAAISPDGQLVAYAAGPAGRTRIYVRQVAGGTPRALTDSALAGARTPRWTPDGQTLTFLVGQSLHSVMALGGASRVLMDASGYEFASPALSPDGSTIAFADDSAIYVRGEGGGPTRMLARAHYPSYLVWSPDGERLAFVSDNAWFIYGLANLGNLAPSSISVVNASGGEPIRITDNTHLNTSPTWTPDSRAVLFVSTQGGGRDIYEQRLTRRGHRAGDPRRLTTGSNAHTISMAADGSRLAYSVLSTRSNLWWAPISAQRPTPFSDAHAVTDENQIVEGMGVSRDGVWLVYDSNRSGQQHIFRIRTAGGEPEQLTHDAADNFLPAWSPDGRWIAYHSWRSGNRDVYVMAADGREPRTVTGYPGHEMYPIWSADGRGLLFISDRATRWELHAIVRTENGWSEPRQVTRNFGYNGRWSPDGRTIAYVSLIDTTLHLTNADGSGSRPVFDGHSLGLTTQQVAFGNRSDVVYFHAVDRNARHGFYELPLRGGSPRLILSFTDPARQPRRFEFDTDGRRLFFTLGTDESDVWLMELKPGGR
jgi:eukaryotic-like serine/threonine-protein kinase